MCEYQETLEEAMKEAPRASFFRTLCDAVKLFDFTKPFFVAALVLNTAIWITLLVLWKLHGG